MMLHPEKLRDPYPINAFPPLLGNAVDEAAFNLGVTIEAAATIVLAAAGVATHGSLKVSPVPGRTHNADFLGVVVSSSGDRMSPLYRTIAKPLYDHDREVLEMHEEAMAQYELDCNVWSAINDGLLNKLKKAAKLSDETNGIRQEVVEHAKHKPNKLRRRSLMCTDITKRAVHDRLEGQGEVIALWSDEFDILNKSGVTDMHGVLNVGNDGGMLTLDRANGTSLVALDPHVNALFIAQAPVFNAYLEESGDDARGVGFLARFFIVWPPSIKGHRFNESSAPKSWTHLSKFHDSLRECLRRKLVRDSGDVRSHTMLEFEHDASERFIAYENNIEIGLRQGQPLHDVPDFASKAMEKVARVAAIFHYVTGQEGRITLDTFERAYDVVMYYLYEAKRIFSDDPKMTELASDCKKLEEYLHGKFLSGWQQLGRRYIRRHGPVRDQLRLEAALYRLWYEQKLWPFLLNRANWVQLNVQHFSTLPA